MTYLANLQPGTPFHLPSPLDHVTGTLREIHGGGAVVMLSKPKTREFRTVSGKTVVFHDPGKRTETWSAYSTVIPEV